MPSSSRCVTAAPTPTFVLFGQGEKGRFHGCNGLVLDFPYIKLRFLIVNPEEFQQEINASSLLT